MSKRVLIGITVVLVLLIGIGGYFYYTRVPKTTPTPTPQFPGEGKPIMGGGGSTNANIEDTWTDTSPKGATSTPPRLYELHKVPVAGATLIETKDKKGNVMSITARYIERGLGHIYETPLATMKEARISNETHSRISEALWGNKGNSVVIRFLGEDGATIKSRILNIGTVSASGFAQTEEVLLSDNIPFMAVAEDSADKLFYLEKASGSIVGTTATFKNLTQSSIFNSSFTEWLPQFPNKDLVTLTTRPSGAVPGHLFFVNTATKSVSKILSDINGLTTLTSRDGKFVLYSESRDGQVELFVYDVAKKESRTLSRQALPEKCVWSAKIVTIAYCAIPQTFYPSIYPDRWYQGLISFTDDVWRIDVKTGVIEKTFVGSFDIITPTLSSDDSYLLFTNKTTGTPWVYRLTEAPLPSLVATTQIATTTSPVTQKATTTPSGSASGMVQVKRAGGKK